MIVAIDPGRVTGWAIFSVAGRLVACGLDDPRASPAHRAVEVSRVVVELPCHRRGSSVPPDDLIGLAVRVGRWQGVYEMLGVEAELAPVVAWKGNVPKAVHQQRAWRKLLPEERTIAAPYLWKGMLPGLSTESVAMYRQRRKGGTQPLETERHNALDAVALGLWAVGR